MAKDVFLDCHRAFTQHSRSWYSSAARLPAGILDEIVFGLYAEEGGTAGEMTTNWRTLKAHRKPTPLLQCFDDSFAVLATFGDVITALSEVDGQDITPEQFCSLLVRCGFKDRTATIRD